MSPVQAYQEAYRANETARKAVAERVAVVNSISSAVTYHLRSFLGFNFNIQIDGIRERFDPKGRVDVAAWPSADELRRHFEAWNAADSALRRAWDAIPVEERSGLTQPPAEMRL